MKNRYIYHYHAYYQLDGRTRTDIDGILQMINPIKTMEDYREAKKVIEPNRAITIASLSFIGREKD